MCAADLTCIPSGIYIQVDLHSNLDSNSDLELEGLSWSSRFVSELRHPNSRLDFRVDLGPELIELASGMRSISPRFHFVSQGFASTARL